MARLSTALIGLGLAFWMSSLVPRPRAALAEGSSGDASVSSNPDQGQEKIAEALRLLQSVQSGRALIRKAMTVWTVKSDRQLLERFRWGAASKTDAVLIRHYDAQSGHESRERQVTVYLRSTQPMEDTVLDMAHELVHATSRPGWDPYDPQLTAGRYIQAAIEGEGGEVEAVRMECTVSRELFGSQPASTAAARCKRYWSTNAVELIRKDFYRVGKWAKTLKGKLGPELKLFPLLSEGKPALYSSTGGAPYPVSLFEEYRQMTHVACENSRRRAASMAEEKNDKMSRAPASSSSGSSPGDGPADGIELFLSRRCR